MSTSTATINNTSLFWKIYMSNRKEAQLSQALMIYLFIIIS